MGSEDITNALFRHFNSEKGYKYQLCNSYVYGWESDFFCIARSGVIYEIEVKISRSDYHADFKKEEKHKILSFEGDVYCRKQYVKSEFEDVEDYFKRIEDPNDWQYPEHSGVQFHPVEEIRPNKFLFAVPEGLITPEEVPDYAGLIYVDENLHPTIVKRPPMLHKEKADLTKVLLEKYYWAYIRMIDQTKAGKNFQLVGEQ